MQPVVSFENVSKQYRIGGARGSLREAAADLVGRVARRSRRTEPTSNTLWAIKDATFQVQPGQVLGIVGRNGAGKTTLLKLLSRVTNPTSGRVQVNGRVSALIELGAGFHPDLTGRENIYLNGVILGMTRREIARKFDRIVAFAELEKFIDTPVKRYSSGMYARLGFSVAAHAEPDLLVLDEVLAVGDSAFQQKCYEFVHSFATSGNTAIFVSHSMYVLEHFCQRLLWIEGGQIAMSGEPGKVLPAYLACLDQAKLKSLAAATAQPGGRLRVGPARLSGDNGIERSSFQTGEDITVTIPYTADSPVPKPHFCIGVAGAGSTSPLFLASMLVDSCTPDVIEGEGSISCRFQSVPLLPRAYTIWGEVWGADRSHLLLNWQRWGDFQIAVEGSKRVGELPTGAVRYLRSDAAISVDYEWGWANNDNSLATKEPQAASRYS